MTWLTSLPAAVLVVGGLAVALLVAIGGRLAVRALVPAKEQDAAYTIAAPLMPTLGALFALFMGLTVASEAGLLASAQGIVSNEAADASRRKRATDRCRRARPEHRLLSPLTLTDARISAARERPGTHDRTGSLARRPAMTAAHVAAQNVQFGRTNDRHADDQVAAPISGGSTRGRTRVA